MALDNDVHRLAGELRSTGIFHCDTRLSGGARLELPAIPGTVMLHVVLDGECTVRVDGVDETLSRGDLAVLPHGRGHQVAVGDGPAVPLTETSRPLLGGIFERLELGGSSTAAHLMCSALTLTHPAAPPLPATLDDLVVVRSTDATADLAVLAAMIEREVSAGGPGWIEVVSRLVDVVAMRGIRAALVEGRGEPGMWRALADPQLAVVMRAVTDDPAEPWTLARMSRVAGMSRSTFAEHFRTCTGESPMAWVARHRMRVAHDLLASGATVSATARATGYDSEVSFRRAYARITGGPPGAVRRAGGDRVR